MTEVMDYAYDLENTPDGQFYEVKVIPNYWYKVPKEAVMKAVGEVWYSRIVYFGVNGIAGALPPNNTPMFVFSTNG